ncbi:GrpB family protein [Scopulibacillus cellulosilyticus]|uniref:GrpB family protein n=1 Tax=Scopulibacillus cellulosilyticus TaxID=2665665 RepID=A0ABW2PWM9_9BACL
MRKVEVKPYNEHWALKFNEEAEKLYKIFNTEILELHHIGSTSVEGLKAKPIIDIMPVVKDIKKIDKFNDAMIAIGYEPIGENGIPGRRYFQKGGDDRTHHIHIFQLDNPEIDRHLAFRDYLRAHLNAAKEYGNLKEALAQRYPYDIESYIKGKEHLVLDIEQKAVEWYQNLKA